MFCSSSPVGDGWIEHFLVNEAGGKISLLFRDFRFFFARTSLVPSTGLT